MTYRSLREVCRSSIRGARPASVPHVRLRQLVGFGLSVLLFLASAQEASAGPGPARSSGSRVQTGAGSPASGPAPTRSRAEVKPRPDRAEVIWPVRGPVTSRFGRRGFAWHRGVDIKTPKGTPIRAAAAGTVVFSGRQSSYGRVIKIAHQGGRSTVYAHNDTNLVKKGDRVKAGSVIGTVGRTGRATANHLHFEIRRQGLAQDPLPLLPRRQPGPVLATQSDAAERGNTPARHRVASEIKTARTATR